MLTKAQLNVLAVASGAPVENGESVFLSASALDVSPIICGRLVTMRLLESRRLDPPDGDGPRPPTQYRITEAGRDAVARGGLGALTDRARAEPG